jgi:hypothetical protein
MRDEMQAAKTKYGEKSWLAGLSGTGNIKAGEDGEGGDPRDPNYVPLLSSPDGEKGAKSSPLNSESDDGTQSRIKVGIGY